MRDYKEFKTEISNHNDTIKNLNKTIFELHEENKKLLNEIDRLKNQNNKNSTNSSNFNDLNTVIFGHDTRGRTMFKKIVFLCVVISIFY